MKKKKLLCTSALLIVILFIIVKCNIVDTKDSLKAISDTSSYSDIILFLENTTNEDSILFEIPKENKVQDYNTYYGNEILLLIGEISTNNLEEYITANIDDFMEYKENDIFESIEKIYYLQKLMDDLEKNYYNEKILAIVENLIKESYNPKGFFGYEEFDEYLVSMTEEEVKTTRISHMMMTLYLCQRYELIDKLDVKTIEEYIVDVIKTNDNVMNLYYASLCYEYLNKDNDILGQAENSYDDDKLDLLELNAYVSLLNRNEISIGQEDKEIIGAKMKAYIAECRLSNMMELFVAIDTMAKLGDFISNAEKERVSSLLHVYQNNDGTFPYITSYILNNKQLLMHYEMTARMGIGTDIKEYEELLSDDFEDQDYYDMYAYAYFASRLGINTITLKNKLTNELSECTLEDESSIGYILLGLSELGVDIKRETKVKNYISEDIINYIQIMTSTETIEYKAQDLILLYGFLKTGMIEITETIVTTVNRIDIEQTESMQALVTYYKFKVLAFAEEEFEYREESEIIDRAKLRDILLMLRCEGGFKMNEIDQSIDLQATYYLINLIEL